MIGQAASSQWQEIILASCRTERLLTTVAKVYVTRGPCQGRKQFFISGKAGRSGGTKRLRWLGYD